MDGLSQRSARRFVRDRLLCPDARGGIHGARCRLATVLASPVVRNISLELDVFTIMSSVKVLAILTEGSTKGCPLSGL